MKKIIVTVLSAVMLAAVLCFAACAMAGKVDESTTTTERESMTSASDMRESESGDMEERISEGLSNAGDAVREGVSDVSEAASDVAEDIREDLDMESEATSKNNND